MSLTAVEEQVSNFLKSGRPEVRQLRPHRKITSHPISICSSAGLKARIIAAELE